MRSAAIRNNEAGAVCIFLALAVLAVFGQTAHFDFVNYDDDRNVYQNPIVEKGLSVQAAGWAFTRAQDANWVPLTTLSHMMDCQLFGLHAGGHHLVNVLLHAATAILLFLALRQMTGSLWRSAFVAAVFAIHPLRAESVAWVSERKDVLSAFFFMLTIGAYTRFVRESKVHPPSPGSGARRSPKSKGFYVLALLFFALGLMSKSMVATLPFVLLLLDWWPLNRMRSAECGVRNFTKLVVEKIPFLALAAGSCAVTALTPGLLIADVHKQPLFERIENALVSYVIYLRQMLFPEGLAIPYPNAPNGEPAWKAGLAFVLLAAITAGVVAWRKKQPWLLTSWLWYLGMLFPVIGIIQILFNVAHADHYTYLPEIGTAIALTWSVAEWSARWKQRRWILGGLMAAVIGALMACARAQTAYWKDSETLWTRTLDCTSGNSVAHNDLGLALAQKGDVDGAIAHYKMALEIHPDDDEVHYNLGVGLFQKGDVEGAIAQYKTALEIAPGNAEYHNNLGAALFAKGAVEDAIAQFEEALTIQPGHADARFNLGTALLKLGRLDEAIAQFRKTLEINPGHENAHYNLGVTLFLKGNLAEAIAQYQKVLETNPGQVNAQGNLAWLLSTAPDASLRNGAKAVALAENASRSTGGRNPFIQQTLAAAYAENGSYPTAVATARRALELALAQKNDALAATLQSEIQLYETDTPERDVTR
jgi:tetratricopeptide (TPR) repeat protein